MPGRVKIKSIRGRREEGMTVEKTIMKDSREANGLGGSLGVTKYNRATLAIAVGDGNVTRTAGVPTSSIG